MNLLIKHSKCPFKRFMRVPTGTVSKAQELSYEPVAPLNLLNCVQVAKTIREIGGGDKINVFSYRYWTEPESNAKGG